MSICPSGVSAPKAGVVTRIYVDAAYVRSLLPVGWEWLQDYLPYMKALEIGDVGAFCALDPPTWSLPSASDLYTFITGGFSSQSDVVTQFLNKLTRMYLWYSLCQCATSTTPTPAAPPSAPAGLPGINPLAVVSPNPTASCGRYGSSYAVINYFDPPAYFFGPPPRATPNYYQLLPVGATSLTMTCTMGAGGTGTYWYDFYLSFYADTDFSKAAIRAEGMHMTRGTTQTRTVAIPADANCMVAWVEQNSTGAVTSPNSATMDVQVYCGGLPGALQSACCPPDPIATGLLQQILGMVTLMQRQVAPFAYIASTQHSTLTGNGTFAVQGLVGLKIEVTTLPAYIGYISGSPTQIFDVGYVSVGSADGYQLVQRVTQGAELWFPPAMGAMTIVGYHLAPNVVCRITELRREP